MSLDHIEVTLSEGSRSVPHASMSPASGLGEQSGMNIYTHRCSIPDTRSRNVKRERESERFVFRQLAPSPKSNDKGEPDQRQGHVTWRPWKKNQQGHAAISYHEACATPLLARVKRRKKGSESVDTAARLLEMLGQGSHSGETTYIGVATNGNKRNNSTCVL